MKFKCGRVSRTMVQEGNALEEGDRPANIRSGWVDRAATSQDFRLES